MKSSHSKGAANKRKGSAGEREYASIFRELGYPLCRTSRQASRLLDDSGVDLVGLPFNVQIKVGIHKGLIPAKVLNIIDERLPKNFLPEDSVHSKYNVLIHHKQGKSGRKRRVSDTIVYIASIDFEGRLEKVIKTACCKYNKETKEALSDTIKTLGVGVENTKFFAEGSKYNKLLIMSFETFASLI